VKGCPCIRAACTWNANSPQHLCGERRGYLREGERVLLIEVHQSFATGWLHSGQRSEDVVSHSSCEGGSGVTQCRSVSSGRARLAHMRTMFGQALTGTCYARVYETYDASAMQDVPAWQPPNALS